MGWRNPPVPWRELERRLSDGRARPAADEAGFPTADGGDSPAWSRVRGPYVAPVAPSPRAGGASVPYAELHAHSAFSFRDGACTPEAMAEEAVRLGLDALALTDHDGLYGVVRFAEAARALGLPTVFGAELTITPTPTTRALGSEGVDSSGPRNAGRAEAVGHLVVLARDPQGYAALSTAISRGQLAGAKEAPRLTFELLAEVAAGAAGHLVALTACQQGAVPRALVDRGPTAAVEELARLVEVFGSGGVVVELWDHGEPLDSARNDALVEVAVRGGVELVATANAHYAAPAQRHLAAALAAVGRRGSLDALDPWLPASGAAHLRSGAEQAHRFARYPGVVEHAAELGRACAFDLALVAPALPPFPCPSGHDEMSWLRELVWRGALRRYGPRGAERVPGAYAQLDHELDVIDRLGFPGYFLVVWDIVEFCRRADIWCQGRGSAANSAACYALGITSADAVALGLLFERFLSTERDGPPDIDIDIESGRREEVIQYVYERHGRQHAAQVANVITYRARSAVRDMARALGYAPGQQDAWAKRIDRWSGLGDIGAAPPEQGPSGAAPRTAGAAEVEIPPDVLELARQVEHLPRHLGIHSGGMVICDRPVVEVCPVEWGRMADRSVLQWDKDDCAAAGLVKFDLLGLGMLSALHRAVDLLAGQGVEVDVALLPQEDAVYDMLCRADSIGVFQVESRAQMATLPRLRPRCFYDLVVEVALIRPGPIQGGSVHPYIRRRNGTEPVTYLHPLLEPALAKTLGIPLFQEQLMQMAIDAAGFTPAEADRLRQAMGAKRSSERMEQLHGRFVAGAGQRGVAPGVAEQIWDKLAAFSSYGFPESHSVSFAYLVYASAWLKLHHPAAFCAALLDAQPMGFYSPHSLVADARRHGVEVRTPDVNASAAGATLEPSSVRAGGPALRLGVGSVRGIGAELAEAVAAGRPYIHAEDLARRAGLTLPQLEALATAGALGCFVAADGTPLDRRAALWAVGAVAQSRPDRLAGIVTGVHAPPLPGLSERELSLADLWATGIAPDGHPTRFLREQLTALGVVPATGLATAPTDRRVLVAGVVTHRQRPATAGGTTFLNLEDETGLVNVICSVGCWTRHRRVARSAPALLVRGRLERTSDGVVNVIADRLDPLPLDGSMGASRDFH